MILLGERIKCLREQRGLTQEDMGNLLHLKRAAISHYERDFRRPDLETLTAIADTLETSTDYLLGRADNPNGIVYPA